MTDSGSIIHVTGAQFEADDEAVLAETGEATADEILGTFDDNTDNEGDSE